MDLNYVYTELQRLTTLVEGWKTAAEVNALERDLVLARLRDLYEAVRFEETVAPAAQEQNASLVPPMPLPEPEPLPDEEFEPLDADDFLSLDSLIQEENIPEEPQTEEQQTEAPAEEDDEENAEPEVEVEFIFADEEEADDEDLLAGLLPDQEEEMADVAEEEPAEEEDVLPIVEEQQPEVEETPEVDEEPAAESEPETTEPEPQPEPQSEPEPQPEPQKPVLSLFGDDEAAKPRYTHRQRVIMSLYDAPEYEEPESRGPVKQVVPSSTQLTEVEAEPELVAVLGEDAEVIYERPTHQPEVELEVETPAEEPLVEEEQESEEAVPETPKVVEPAPQPQPAPQLQPQPQTEPEQPKTLGESVQPRPTLADQLAARQQASLHRPVTDLRRAVSLNDKLLMIRELFNGNGALYEITIRKLNDFTTFEDCLIYIAEHFDWNPNSDGAKLMVDLLERKFKQ